jgi:hypothetical protein
MGAARSLTSSSIVERFIQVRRRLKMNRGIIVGVVAALLLGTTTSAQAGKKKYVIQGKLEVEHHGFMKQALGRDRSPLANVKVKIAGRRKVGFAWGWFKKWGVVRTDSQGRFKLTKRKVNAKRRIRVKVQFRSPGLEVRHAKATADPLRKKCKWYKVYQENKGQGNKSPTRNFNFVFGDGGNALNNREPHYHAEIWTLYRAAMACMDQFGFPFRSQIKVKYPHTPSVAPNKRASYANPINDVIYLLKNDHTDPGRDIGTMLHELMHIWAYQHSRKENRVAEYLAWHLKKGTHGIVEKTYVAFHEGFAEWAAQVLAKEIRADQRWTPKPLSKLGMKQEQIQTFDHVDSSDAGWLNTFKLMQKDKLWQFDYGTSDDHLQRKYKSKSDLKPWRIDSEVGQLTFSELLGVFTHGSKDLHVQQMNWDDFTHIVVSRSNGVDADDIKVYRAILDVQQSREDVLKTMGSKKTGGDASSIVSAPGKLKPVVTPGKVQLEEAKDAAEQAEEVAEQLPRIASAWRGTWETTYGTLRLQQSGERVRGDYPSGNGLIKGKHKPDQGVLRGTFVNEKMDRTGHFQFRLKDDGKRFKGQWGWEKQSMNKSWQGTRKSSERPELSIAKPLKASAPSWRGTWETTYGTLRIQQSGHRVRGDYPAGDGVLKGKYQPGKGVLSGTFRNNRMNRDGRLRFRLTDDGKKFEGKWGWKNEPLDKSWQGTRKSRQRPELTIAEPLPE